MGQVLQDLANCGDLDLTSSTSTPPSLKRSYSHLKDSFPSPPESSDTSSTTRDVRVSRSPDNPPPPRSHSRPSSTLTQSSNRAVPPITLPPATAPSALPTGELPISPTSQFLQSYVATLPLDGITISSNPLFQPFDPVILNDLSTGGTGDIATSTPFPISTDFTSSGTKTTDWDNLIRFGFHSSSAAASDSLRFAPGSSSSASHLVGDPYLGIPGFGGSIGFAAEAQAFVGGGGIGADDVDWGSILNFGSNLDHARISKPSDA
ncbi:hypothetical protein DL93DRAFT_846890 [Clavulina sp. PMI_390]|nr:hypothetical protein DL93DRAFT_846890 [Clavulina sp. PMI_390]